jgi:hypothetical protein
VSDEPRNQLIHDTCARVAGLCAAMLYSGELDLLGDFLQKLALIATDASAKVNMIHRHIEEQKEALH